MHFTTFRSKMAFLDLVFGFFKKKIVLSALLSYEVYQNKYLNYIVETTVTTQIKKKVGINLRLQQVQKKLAVFELRHFY